MELRCGGHFLDRSDIKSQWKILNPTLAYLNAEAAPYKI